MSNGAPKLYPWLRQSWRSLEAAWRLGRPPSGLLLSGPPGIGLERFVERLQYFLFCEQPGQVVNADKAARLLAVGAHPDLLQVRPAPPAQSIRVEQVRELLRFWELGSRFGGVRMVLLAPAEALQRSSGDTLLKILEEAPPGALLVLLARRARSLPATLRSRCLQLPLRCQPESSTLEWLRERLAPEEDAAAWLRMTRAGPLAVQKMAAEGEGALRNHLRTFLNGRETLAASLLADDWQKQGASQVLEWLRRLIFERIRVQLAAGKIHQRPARFPLGVLIDYHAFLLRKLRELESSGGAREVSLLEESVLAWRHPRLLLKSSGRMPPGQAPSGQVSPGQVPPGS